MMPPALEIRSWRDQGITFPRMVVIHRAERARGERGRRADSPLVAVEAVCIKAGQAITIARHSIAVLDVIVVPAEELVGLRTSEETSLGEIERDCGHKTTTDQVDCVVVGEVHRSPPHPQGVGDKQRLQPGEDLAHEQRSQCRIGSMQRWEGTEHDRRLSEARGVQVDAQELVNASKTCWVSLHRVVCWGQSIEVLIPRRRAGEQQLNGDSSHADVSKGPGENGNEPRRTEDKHDQRADKGGAIVTQSIRNPGQNIEHHILVSRQNVTNVGAVKDVFQRW